MSVQLKFIENVWAPIVECDYCGKEIDDASWGSVLWDTEKPEEFHFAHKPCDPSEPIHSEELTTFLDDLLHNATRNTKKG